VEIAAAYLKKSSQICLEKVGKNTNYLNHIVDSLIKLKVCYFYICHMPSEFDIVYKVGAFIWVLILVSYVKGRTNTKSTWC